MITYDNEQHKYFLEGRAEPLSSVTEIASAICGLNTDYMASNEKIQLASARGTSIHNELADWFDPSFKEEQELSDDARPMAELFEKSEDFRVEQIVYNVEKGYAGTADLIEIHGTTVKRIIDFKTMDKPKKKYCQIQLSLYRLALISMGYNCDETKLIIACPTGCIEHEPLTWDEIMAMRSVELEPNEEDAKVLEALEIRMAELAPYVQEYKETESAYKSAMLELFESHGATKYNGLRHKVTFVEPSVRVSLDTNKLKAEHPDIYEAYKKESKVAGFVKLTTIKEANDE